MRVKILPPHGSDRSALDERSWAELPAGSTVRDALRLIRCSPLKAKLLLNRLRLRQNPEPHLQLSPALRQKSSRTREIPPIRWIPD